MNILDIQIRRNDKGTYNIHYFGFGLYGCWQTINDVTEEQIKQITRVVMSMKGDKK